MSRIPQETIDRINDNADIVDIVSKSVDLKQSLGTPSTNTSTSGSGLQDNISPANPVISSQKKAGNNNDSSQILEKPSISNDDNIDLKSYIKTAGGFQTESE